MLGVENKCSVYSDAQLVVASVAWQTPNAERAPPYYRAADIASYYRLSSLGHIVLRFTQTFLSDAVRCMCVGAD